jgi:hypothetical protein
MLKAMNAIIGLKSNKISYLITNTLYPLYRPKLIHTRNRLQAQEGARQPVFGRELDLRRQRRPNLRRPELVRGQSLALRRTGLNHRHQQYNLKL